jgi:hypothetical protein
MVRRKVIQKKVPTVTMATHPAFFQKYEDERRRFQETTGVILSQKAFTEMMAKVKIDFSKIRNNIINGTKKYYKK